MRDDGHGVGKIRGHQIRRRRLALPHRKRREGLPSFGDGCGQVVRPVAFTLFSVSEIFDLFTLLVPDNSSTAWQDSALPRSSLLPRWLKARVRTSVTGPFLSSKK